MPSIFIGSSTEQLDFAKKIEEWIEETKCTTKLWSEILQAGDITIAKLIEAAEEADGAVFVFGEDDKTWFRNERLRAPRDNVLYELGLFTGSAANHKLKRVVFCRVGESKVASDLQGVTYVAVKSTTRYSAKTRNEIQGWARTIATLPVRRAVVHNEFQITSKKDLFEVGTKLIGSIQKNVSLSAKTPVPIMGPRPYELPSSPFAYEREQFQAYWDLAERASGGELRFSLIASIPCIRGDLGECPDPEFSRRVQSNIKNLFALSKRKGSELRLYWYEGLSLPAFLVADSKSLLWWKSGNGDSVWITDESATLSSALMSVNERVFKVSDQTVVLKRILGNG